MLKNRLLIALLTLLLVLGIGGVCNVVNAQAPHNRTNSNTSLPEYRHRLSFTYSYVGYYSWFHTDHYGLGYFGTLNMTYDRKLTDKLAFTASLSYASVGGKGLRSSHDDDYDYMNERYYDTANGSFRTNSLYIMNGAKWYFLDRPFVKLYMRGEFGIALHFDKDREWYVTDRDFSGTYALNVIPFGIHVGGKTSFTAEVGLGSNIFLIAAGISHTF